VETFSVLAGLVTLALSMNVVLGYAELHEEYLVVRAPPLGLLSARPFVEAELFIDSLSSLMCFIVSSIGFLVVVFSLGYMHGDKGYARYYAFILLFIGGMLGVVLAGNLALLYLFWEVVGLCSCALIAHWYERPEASRAGVKAFIVTRAGDAMMLTGIVLAYMYTGTLSYEGLPSAFKALEPATLTLILLLCLGGAIGKSAQLPLHVWLPDAMEGPTTVSALIHAATMVKAGVYLVARLETLTLLYGGVPSESVFRFLEVTAIIGGLTAFIAGTMAVVAMDIKRVLAYSTISQLGYMFLALGLAGFTGYREALAAGLYHLSSHAFFKALLFLSAGSIIHALETRDMRLMGGLMKYMPVTSVALVVGGLSLMGIPPFNGFWSKDMIVHYSLEALHESPLPALLAVGAAVLTALYTARMIYYVIIRPPSSHVLELGEEHKLHEAPPVMTIPLLILSVMCLASPLAFSWIVEAHHQLGHVHVFHVEPLSLASSMAAVGLGLGAFYAGYYVIGPDKVLSLGAAKALHKVLCKGYYFDDLYELLFIKGVAGLGSAILKVVDRVLDGLNIALALGSLALCALAKGLDRIIDGLNELIAYTSLKLGAWITTSHTGKLTRYVTAVMLGLTLMMIIAALGW